MKLLRYGNLGSEKAGLLDLDGNIRDISAYCVDLTPATLGDFALIDKLKSLDTSTCPLVESTVRIGACVSLPGKIICVGYNSKLHAEEMGVSVITSNDILVFLKASSCMCGPQDPILYTKNTKKLDWEAELGVVIGKKGKYITKEDASDYILGYTCINDLSERYLQLETQDTQYTKGKNFDNSAPIGPYLVTKDEIVDSSNINVQLWVNNELRQNFNTKDYLYNDCEIISYLSQYLTLYPGDIISMGSAPGSAAFWGQDFFLKPQDTVILEIAGIGMQKQTVIIE